jgi:hypothetical protein
MFSRIENGFWLLLLSMKSIVSSLTPTNMMLEGIALSKIMLVGVRDVRDYRIYLKEQKEWITGGSAFSISAESARMPRI